MLATECLCNIQYLYSKYKLWKRCVKWTLLKSIEKKLKNGANPEEIIEWMSNYLEDENSNWTKPQYILHATTFVNQERRYNYLDKEIVWDLLYEMEQDMFYENKEDWWYVKTTKDWKNIYENKYWDWWYDIRAIDHNTCKNAVTMKTTFTSYKKQNG